MTYTDHELLDFLHGRLDEKSSARIEQTMRIDRELERRVMSLDRVAAPVREAMKQMPGNHVLNELAWNAPQSANGGRHRRKWRDLAAALMVGAMLGSGAIWVGLPTQEDWRARVAQYQSLYVVDTVRYTIAPPDALKQQVAIASQSLGRSLDETSLNKPSAISLARVQVLGIDDAPLVQVVYRAEDGTPFALCITTSGATAGLEEPVSEHLHGLATTAWSDDSFRYILVGGEELEVTRELANQLKAVL